MSQTADLDGFRHRLAEARRDSGRSVEAVAKQLGINQDWYRDLEQESGEVTTLSLAQVMELARSLGVDALELLVGKDGQGRGHAPIPPSDLADLLKEDIERRRIPLEEFEEMVGWGLREFLERPEALWDVANIDWLGDVCAAVGADWKRVISSWKRSDGAGIVGSETY